MDLSVKAVVPALCADVLTFAANPLSAAPDRFAASTVPVTATALFASQNAVVDVDNTASLPVRWYPANTFLPRRAEASGQEFPDTSGRAKEVRYQVRERSRLNPPRRFSPF